MKQTTKHANTKREPPGPPKDFFSCGKTSYKAKKDYLSS